jgi:hypothetical protein
MKTRKFAYALVIFSVLLTVFSMMVSVEWINFVNNPLVPAITALIVMLVGGLLLSLQTLIK